MYNPFNTGMDSLLQQRQMLDQQINMMQGYQQPNVTVNNMTAPTPDSFDFNGRYVSGEDEAKKIIGNNKPVLSIDKNEPFLYMSNNGVFKKYMLQEVIEEPKDSDRINALEGQISALGEQLQAIMNVISGEKKTAKRGKINEPAIQTNDK